MGSVVNVFGRGGGPRGNIKGQRLKVIRQYSINAVSEGLVSNIISRLEGLGGSLARLSNIDNNSLKLNIARLDKDANKLDKSSQVVKYLSNLNIDIKFTMGRDGIKLTSDLLAFTRDNARQ